MGPHCIERPIRLDNLGNITFENKAFQPDMLVAHLKKHHSQKEFLEFSIEASEDAKANDVVILSDLLKQHFPDIQISFSVADEA